MYTQGGHSCQNIDWLPAKTLVLNRLNVKRMDQYKFHGSFPSYTSMQYTPKSRTHCTCAHVCDSANFPPVTQMEYIYIHVYLAKKFGPGRTCTRMSYIVKCSIDLDKVFISTCMGTRTGFLNIPCS